MYLGIEIGGTKLQLGVGDAHGRVRDLVRVPVARRRGRAGILEQIAQAAPGLIARHPVRTVGIGFGGPVDGPRGRVVKSHQVAGWSGFDLRRWAERTLGLPAVLENDSNCAALAEAVCGAGRGKRLVFYTNVGTGIGGGFVVDGRLHNGRYGAAEIGHTRLFHKGEWRTIESLASGLAIERGVSTVEQAARFMGVAIANMIALFNPEIVVVGGGVSLAGAKFFGPLRSTVRGLVFAPYRRNYRLVPAALGEAVVVVGATLVAAGTNMKREN